MSLYRLFETPKALSKYEMLYGKSEAAAMNKRLAVKKKKNFVLTLTITVIIVLVLIISAQKEGNTIEAIKRNEPGSGTKTVSLIANYGNNKTEKIAISVNEKKYSADELETYSQRFKAEMSRLIIGENNSLDSVSEDLNLCGNYNSYPFGITWTVDKPLLMSSKGIIDEERLADELERINEKSIPVRLCARLQYYDFTEDIYCYVVLVKKKYGYEQFRLNVNKAIQEEDDNSKTDDYQTLPNTVDGVEISFTKKNTVTIVLVVLIGITCSVGLVVAKDKELDKEVLKRDKELECDYPRILNQYVLYYCAGMNHRMIWKQICEGYKDGLSSGKSKRFAYEEMLRTLRQLEDGYSEIEAYEEFARRCHLVKYRTFVSIIEQSITKGRDRLDIILDEEMAKARTEENNRVRMAIQEMATKLLFPMIMMLIVVLVIVMVPAFISFSN